ncbi:MAG: xanthine phosphoribosyltransferase [Clostridia bacterium]|nr:xanthine phosphoribosyltransferase [Clostridia bacterium]
MSLLKERIETAIANGNTPDLGRYLNRTLDPAIISEVAEAIANAFQGENVTRVLTAEPAGIAIAYKVAELLSAKAVFARKREETACYEAVVNSKTNTTLRLPRKYLTAGDSVLIVDDVLAMGGIAQALIEITRQSEANLVGVGVAIEKSYLATADKLRARGIAVYSLVKVLTEDEKTLA